MAENTPTKLKLPKLVDLVSSNLEEIYKNELLNQYLSQSPPASWIKTHPYIKNYKYLPIDKIELLLRKIFKRYKIEVLKTGMLLNAVETSVRVHFYHPIFEEWNYHDGVGACEVQTKSQTGSLMLDMSNISPGAISMALPIAKTMAVKDACDHFGPLFGSDINRKDTVEFKPDQELEKKASKAHTDKIEKLLAI